MSFIDSNILLSFVLFFVFCTNSSPAAATANTEPRTLTPLPFGVKTLVGGYLSFEDLTAFAQADRCTAAASMEVTADRYADCILKNQPVPPNVMNILRHCSPDAIKTLTVRIAGQIKRKLGTNILIRSRSLPEFLKPYFYKITSDDLDFVCQPMVVSGTLPAATLEHMKMNSRTYWRSLPQENTDKREGIDKIAKQYMTLTDALTPGASPPKYIVATQLETTDPNNFAGINSLFGAHPESVLIIDFGTHTQIPPDYRLSGLNNVRHVSFVGAQVTRIGHSFLSGCSHLTSIDLSALRNVASIGGFFLRNCSSLTSVDLSALRNVASIGDYFLWGCSSLTSVDLSALRNVASIDDAFLSGCSHLTSVDLSALRNVASIGSYFLCDCSSLTSVDLSALRNVASIGDYFLNRCSSLGSILVGPRDSTSAGCLRNAIATSSDQSKIVYAEQP